MDAEALNEASFFHLPSQGHGQNFAAPLVHPLTYRGVRSTKYLEDVSGRYIKSEISDL